jgi:hypothetical protein
MSSSLVVDLRDGYREVACALSEESSALLARARDSSNAGRRERGRSLRAIVDAYRAGPRELWGPVLLDLLAPALLARLQRLRAEPPAMDEEDIRQQLVLELLRAAATMPLPAEPGYLKSRLVARANQGVRRWLAREGCRQMRQQSFEAMEEERT